MRFSRRWFFGRFSAAVLGASLLGGTAFANEVNEPRGDNGPRLGDGFSPDKMYLQETGETQNTQTVSYTGTFTYTSQDGETLTGTATRTTTITPPHAAQPDHEFAFDELDESFALDLGI